MMNRPPGLPTHPLIFFRKKTIETVDQFDFLKDIVSSIPDPLESQQPDNVNKPIRASRKPRVKEE